MNLQENFKVDNEIGISNKLSFIFTTSENLYTKFDSLKRIRQRKSSARIIMLMNQRDILVYDTVLEEWLAVSRIEFYKQYDFFLPLMGREKSVLNDRKTVNVRIGEKFAQLYNELLILNSGETGEEEKLRPFLVRLLFCFFADSFGIIMNGSLHQLITMYSKQDGSDLSKLINHIFLSLYNKTDNTVPEYVTDVIVTDNISFFATREEVSTFDASTRKLLLDICEMDWSEVEPDVLGSLIQTIAFPEMAGVAYNYTSTANVYKVIGPLFLNDLYDKFEKAKGNAEKCKEILREITCIKVFDPACGTGNFLMITFRELKLLERRVKTHLREINGECDSKYDVEISQFYGIELNPLACDIAKIGLYFINYKMSMDEEPESIRDLNWLGTNNVIQGIATEYEWDKVCPKDQGTVYIIGNPSYRGARKQTDIQKRIVKTVFKEEIERVMKIGDIDFAACWFYLAAKYISGTNSGFAFVTTNSLTQGVQVPELWPVIFNKGVEISFAHTAFKWKNDGQNNTAVTVVIVGCRSVCFVHEKTIFNNNIAYDVEKISPYLTAGDVIVHKENRASISGLPAMVKGNMPYGKELLLTPTEKDEILTIYPEAAKFLKRVVGSEEFIHNIERWCLWIKDNDLNDALSIPVIAERIENVKQARLASTDKSAHKLAGRAHQFRETNEARKYTLVIPSVSSEKRKYFQVGYVSRNTIVTNLSFAIYDADPWVFGLIASRMHNLWVRTVCGGLETRIRYSNVIGYNTFPIPVLSAEQKNNIRECVFGVIMEREKESERTLAELYDPDEMPEGLLYAHKILDSTIENCYREGGFYTNQERLDCMFELYKQLKGE
ncbi:type IIL restriction-modification enzyme MmeI [Anaerovirgula multivorans]|uniref:type IIL restriction-modification enzyme MmeI n=1 Tax=Anaerovirgula multivorans TaxID=312168 RepID=UPI0015953560|nr:type IIL restriction-modification enzyme MmeI [Anaerovirgula multivorans]